MTRVVLFDLGDTIEVDNALRPGAMGVLRTVQAMRDGDRDPIALALISDFEMAEDEAEVAAIRQKYLAIVEELGIRPFFEPVDKRITLSTEVRVFKPDERIFRRALEKIEPGLHFHDAVFVTENVAHVDAARELGMSAIHLRGPGQSHGDVDDIEGLIPLLERVLRFPPCGKNVRRAKGRRASQAGRSKSRDQQIVQLVEQVDTERLLTIVDRLVGFGTRWSYSPRIAEVTDWLRSHFASLGYGGPDECWFQEFALPGAGPQRNVLAHKGTSDRGIILVCAHYDSISERSREHAPGADDNGSGVAAVLEIARLLAPLDLKRQVRLALFGGEEQGLFGSGACAEVAARERWPIDVVINLDMIGFTGGPPRRVVVEYDQGNGNPANDAAAKAFGLMMAQAGADYTTLEIEHTDIWNSDYMPFESQGFACIGAYEGGENPHYHKTSDTPAQVDGAYLREVTQMVLATVLQVAR